MPYDGPRQEDDLDMVETFYHTQLEAAHKRLYELVQQLIQLVTCIHVVRAGSC